MSGGYCLVAGYGLLIVVASLAMDRELQSTWAQNPLAL